MEKKKGRPLKPNPNLENKPLPEFEAKPTVAEATGITEVTRGEVIQLSNIAFSVVTLPSGQNALVRIRYDAVSGKTAAPEIQIIPGDRMDAEERLKIALVDELLRY